MYKPHTVVTTGNKKKYIYDIAIEDYLYFKHNKVDGVWIVNQIFDGVNIIKHNYFATAFEKKVNGKNVYGLSIEVENG